MATIDLGHILLSGGIAVGCVFLLYFAFRYFYRFVLASFAAYAVYVTQKDQHKNDKDWKFRKLRLFIQNNICWKQKELLEEEQFGRSSPLPMRSSVQEMLDIALVMLADEFGNLKDAEEKSREILRKYESDSNKQKKRHIVNLSPEELDYIYNDLASYKKMIKKAKARFWRLRWVVKHLSYRTWPEVKAYWLVDVPSAVLV